MGAAGWFGLQEKRQKMVSGQNGWHVNGGCTIRSLLERPAQREQIARFCEAHRLVLQSHRGISEDKGENSQKITQKWNKKSLKKSEKD